MRKLRAEEVECRVATINEKGCSLLLYKDARVDMRMLDEEFGRMNWKREHESIDGKMFCTISVWDDDKKEWISKQDVGVESYTEATKGESSDSFKRAGFCWGIGRELYTAPFIWVDKSGVKLTESNGKYKTFDRFVVKQIEYEDDQISKLEIVNNRTKQTVWSMGVMQIPDSPKQEVKPKKAHKPSETPTEADKGKQATPGQVTQIEGLCTQESVPTTFIAKSWGVDGLSDLTMTQAYKTIVSFDAFKEKYEEGIPFK